MRTMRDPYTIDRYEPGYDFDSDPRGSAVYYEDMVILIDKIKAGHSEEVTDLRDALAAAIAERAHYGDMMTARLGQCENERDAARAEAAELQAERDEIVAALDEYGWWMDNTNMLERLKFALAVGQEKSDDLATLQLAARGAWTTPVTDNSSHVAP